MSGDDFLTTLLEQKGTHFCVPRLALKRNREIILAGARALETLARRETFPESVVRQQPRFTDGGQGLPQDPRLYPTHIPLNSFQKGAVAVLSAVGAALRPQRADLVAAVGETTGWAAYAAMRERMRRSAAGRLILEQRPRITDDTLAEAAAMPPGTFGHAWGQFMGRRKFTADERPPVRFVDDADLAYVALRNRQVHDLWHVLFSCPTTVCGELGLKALEFVQTGLPMSALSVAGASWRLKPQDRQFLTSHYLPWALQAGTRCADLMSLRYEHHFQEDLLALRQRWRVLLAPQKERTASSAALLQATQEQARLV